MIVYSQALQQSKQISKDVLAKMDRALQLKVKTHLNDGSMATSKTQTNINLILRSTDIESTRQFITANKGAVRTVIGSIMTLTIPSVALVSLTERTEVIRIESSKPVKYSSKKNVQEEFPSIIQLTESDKLHSENNPDKRSYTGKGVIVGIIDSGIDFLHPDFGMQGDSTKTRIISYWDQNTDVGVGLRPKGFNYGREIRKEEINQAISKQDKTYQGDTDGHGTHVTCIAAGSGNLISKYKGLAPDAEIVVVSIGFSDNLRILDAAKYIYEIAEREGKPAVINMSLGYFNEPIDGESLVDIGLTEFVEQKEGRVLVAAIGNDGGGVNRWLVRPSPDSSVIRMNYYSCEKRWDSTSLLPDIYGGLNFVIPESSLDSVTVSFGLDSVTNVIVVPYFFGDSLRIESTPQSNGKTRTVREIGSQTSNIILDTLRYQQSGIIAGIIEYTLLPTIPGYVSVSVIVRDILTKPLVRTDIIPFTNGHDLFRINISSVGRPVTVFHNNSYKALPSNVISPNYKVEDGTWSDAMTVSSPASAKGVIAVGSYNHRTSHIGLDGQIKYAGDGTSGDLSGFSSAGPTLDGRLKPDITAPGGGVISARANTVNTTLVPDIIVQGGRYIIYSGTSMSSPVVAGGIAQYLEKYPNKTYKEIRTEIQQRAVRDGFTSSKGSLPNNYWGYGKFSAYNLFFPNTSNVDEFSEQNNSIIISPNPAQNTVRISCPDISGAMSVDVYSLLGEKMISASSSQSELSIDIKNLVSGMYMVKIVGGQNNRRSFLMISR